MIGPDSRPFGKIEAVLELKGKTDRICGTPGIHL